MVARVPGGAATRLLIKRPAGKLTPDELVVKLEESGRLLTARLVAAPSTAANQRALRHVVGIERWGQRRLRALLGEAPPVDEYAAYQPDKGLGWDELREMAERTRRETVALARRLAQEAAPAEATIRHNQHGDLTAREWLYYLDLHARLESRRIR